MRTWRPWWFVCLLTLAAAGCDDDDFSPSPDVSPSPDPVSEPNLVLSSTALDFNEVGVGSEQSLSFTISNAGESVLTVASLSVEDEASRSSYRITPASPNIQLASGDEFDVEVVFAPVSAGDYNDTLLISSNDPDSPHRLSLEGVGLSADDDQDNDGFSSDLDCDDLDPNRYPGATEVPYDGIDQDCNGTDLNDVDEDGYIGTAADGDDCDDSDPDVHPDAEEIPYDGIDQDCLPDNEMDLDSDGYDAVEGGGDDCNDENPDIHPDAAEIPYDGIDQDCDGQDMVDVDKDGFVAVAADGTDCNDEDPTVYPMAAENPYDGIDQDCSGADVTDVDDDGYDAFQVGGDDCNDGDASIHPGVEDIPYDEIDQDCSGEDESDVDNDGYIAEESFGDDCDDEDPNTYPGAVEFADARDNDCDGLVDEDLDTTDDDQDTFSELDGDCNDYDNTIYPGAQEVAYDGIDQDCDRMDLADVDEDGYESWEVGGTDCDDTTAQISPMIAESCNGIDDNCDGNVDEGVKDTFYADTDEDTYGDLNSIALACTAPSGYVADASDCDDTNDSVSPAGLEVCNEIDDDCDLSVDEDVTSTFYADTDGDGYGDGDVTRQACAATLEWVADSTDCDDSLGSTYPGAAESCNLIDDNCDSEIDEGVKLTFYRDADQDGYGDANTTTLACTASDGWVANSTDCDDTRASSHPGATDVPYDGVDNDCMDGDEVDVDNDSYTATQAGGDDCDDSRADVHPGATELDDDRDNDCDGKIDEELNTTDDDGDGFSEATGDCADDDPTRNPNADETCNGKDDDCDGATDENVKLVFYRDSDGDGYGAASLTTQACTAPSGYVSDNTDCNDSMASVHPNASESCNGLDDNCNGTVDEGVKTVYYRDVDGDGYGVSSLVTESCSIPTGYSARAGDCDDTRASVNPGATETCNGIDDNCSGTIDEGVANTYYRDGDSDGYGSSSSVQACSAPPGYVTVSGDCDDTRANINPGRAESCDSLDNNCDGQIDEGVTNTYYLDADHDGYGTALSTTQACSLPGGYATTNTDCNDSASTIYPGAPERCNSIDDDCDKSIDEGVTTTFYQDADKDTYGNPSVSQIACTAPTGYVTNKTDCNDSNAAINPGASEVCDGVDNNCNGDIDGADAVDGVIWFYDGDMDGYGTQSTSVTSCEAPEGFVDNNLDCDDRYIWGEEEVCDGVDNDCDGNTDFAGGYVALRVGYYPRALVMGDFNKDGQVDMAVANYNGSSVSILMHTGVSGFQLRQTVSVGSGPIDLVMMDYDADGDVDLFVSNYSSQTVTVIRNNGKGEFAAAATVSLGFQPYGLAGGDLDKDGDLDLAVANYSGSGVAWLRNSAGTFTLVPTVASGLNPSGVAVGDWDGDGDLDLAVANYNGDSLTTFQNNGSGTFTLRATSTVGGGPIRVVTGDFNADGKLDIATNNYKTNTITVLKGGTGGVFTPLTTVAVGSSPSGLTASDLDGDNDLDLAVANYASHTLSILRNNGAGSFVVTQSPGIGYQPWAILAGDVDDDGDADLNVTTWANGSPNGMLFVVPNLGSANFLSPNVISTASNPYGVLAGDFNGDGLQDMAVAAYGTHAVLVYLQQSNGTFLYTSSTTVQYYPQRLVSADFDDDGILDLAVSCGHDNNRLYALKGDGTGKFTATYIPSQGRSYGIDTGDFDGDGDIDIAYSNYYTTPNNSNKVVILLNDGLGTFSEGQVIQVGLQPLGLRAADIDMDGDIDLACANYTSNYVSVMTNNGHGIFTISQEISSGANPYNLLLTDMDGDLAPDIVVANYSSHTLGLFVNDTTGHFSAMLTMTAGAQPYDLVNVDFDEDGDDDLAVTNLGQGTLTLAINQGGDVFTEAGYAGLAGPGYFVNPIWLGQGSTGELGLMVSSYHTSAVTLLERECQ